MVAGMQQQLSRSQISVSHVSCKESWPLLPAVPPVMLHQKSLKEQVTEKRWITGVLESFSTFCKCVSINFCRLCGFPPFYEENNQKLFDMIKNCEFDFPSPYWDDVSDMAKDLIKSLLVKDPKKRLDAEQLLEHPWVRGISTPRVSLPNVTQQIKEFNARRKLKVRIQNVNNECREQPTRSWQPIDLRIS
jgi:serine/threonine protein kinase